jgi:hypothetical protein
VVSRLRPGSRPIDSHSEAGLRQASVPAGAYSLAGAWGAGERYESKTRAFSRFFLFSSMNFRCRAWSWHLSWAALLTKTMCSETSKSRSFEVGEVGVAGDGPELVAEPEVGVALGEDGAGGAPLLASPAPAR